MVKVIIFICLAGVSRCDDKAALWRLHEESYSVMSCMMAAQTTIAPDAILGKRTMRVECQSR